MTVRVITPPEPIVSPVDIAGDHAVDDASVTSMIAAVTEAIVGPSGWLGRSLGPQTLELTLPAFCGRNVGLPCLPIIGPATVKYLDRDGVEQTVDAADYRLIDSRIWLNHGFAFPATACEADAVRIRYEAGYNGAGIDKTGIVPERARQAIILSVQHLKSLSVDSLYLRVDEVDGVGRKEFTLSDQASNIVDRTCDRLLVGLRLYS